MLRNALNQAVPIHTGTIWTQNILSLIYHEGHRKGTEDTDLIDRVPWLEYKIRERDYINRPSPRLFASHMPYFAVPKGLKNGRGKIIYVARNPKDVLVSYYHFSKFSVKLEEVEDFNVVMERFLAGNVLGNLWLDHIEGWAAQRNNLSILFLMYEEMKKDLRSSVLKICNFLDKKLTEEELDDVVDKASFGKMSVDRRTNYTTLPPNFVDFNKGRFLRKAVRMEPSHKQMFKHKGAYFLQDTITAEYIDSLENFEIRDSDIFLVTFPKSGTIWTQNILSLICHEGHRNGTEDTVLIDRVPWLEYIDSNSDYANRPSPRLFTTHLPYDLVPKGFKNGRGKIIYVARNPKDVLVSYYHFSKVSVQMEDEEDFDIFMERFLSGKGSEELCIENMQLPRKETD